MSIGRRLGTIAHSSLTDTVYSSIRDSIVSGTFRMGERLIESELAQNLGTSRGPVREALRQLREQGLVVERPRQGNFVAQFDARDLIDIYNVRLALETTAIRLAIRRNSSTRPLEQQIERMRTAAEAGDTNRVVEAEFAFHERLCMASENEYLLRVFRTMSASIRMALTLDNAAYADFAGIPAEHQPIVDIIRAKDEAAAVLTIETHILSTIGQVLQRLSGERTHLLDPLGKVDD